MKLWRVHREHLLGKWERNMVFDAALDDDMHIINALYCIYAWRKC